MKDKIPREVWDRTKKQNVIDVKRIMIRKLNQTINTNIYLQQSKTSIWNKIWRYDSKSGKYIPNPRRYHNCQKYRYLKEACTRKSICMKCEAYELDDTKETYKNNLN